MKETIQLQFGAFSNGIGAEMITMEYLRAISGDQQIDHSSLLRPINSHSDVRFEPRIIAYDLEGNFNSNSHQKTGSGISKSQQYDTNQVYDDMIQPWGHHLISDHCQLNQHNKFPISTDIAALFTTASDASEYLSDHERLREDASDPIRAMLEKCDHLDVIHSVADLHRGFGALALAVLTHVQDEYCRASTVPFLTFGTEPHLTDDDGPCDLNRFTSLTTLAPLSALFVPLRSKLANDVVLSHLCDVCSVIGYEQAVGAHGLSLHTNTSAYRLLQGGLSASDLIDRLKASCAGLGSILTVPVDGLLDEIRTEPITNDHLVLQGDHDDEYHRQVMDRLDLTRGSLHSDQTRLRTPVKLSPSSTLSVHRHQATELNVIGQWRSSESTFDFVNELWKKAGHLKSVVASDQSDQFDDRLEYLSNLKSDLIYYRSQHVVRTAPHIRIHQQH